MVKCVDLSEDFFCRFPYQGLGMYCSFVISESPCSINIQGSRCICLLFLYTVMFTVSHLKSTVSCWDSLKAAVCLIIVIHIRSWMSVDATCGMTLIQDSYLVYAQWSANCLWHVVMRLAVVFHNGVDCSLLNSLMASLLAYVLGLAVFRFLLTVSVSLLLQAWWYSMGRRYSCTCILSVCLAAPGF